MRVFARLLRLCPLAAETRLIADDGASAALALKAMAHGDVRWLALNREVKLPATADGASGGHWVGSVASSDASKRVLIRVVAKGEVAPAKVLHSAVSKEVGQCLFLAHQRPHGPLLEAGQEPPPI
jgi:hypothetical protein